VISLRLINLQTGEEVQFEITDLRSKELVEAVRVWTGWGTSMFPNRDHKRVAEHFSFQNAAKLLPLIHALHREFYESDAHSVASTVEEVGRIESDQFRKGIHRWQRKLSKHSLGVIHMTGNDHTAVCDGKSEDGYYDQKAYQDPSIARTHFFA